MTIDSAKLAQLDQGQDAFYSGFANIVKRINRIQGRSSKQLEKALPGIKASVWRAYAQQSYDRHRPLYAFAAFGWLSQTATLELCNNPYSERLWSLPETVLSTVLHSRLLPHQYFIHWLDTVKGAMAHYELESAISDYRAYGDQEHNHDFLMPTDIDMEQFHRDYHQSIASGLQVFRQSIGMSKEDMALIMGVSPDRYQSYEQFSERYHFSAYSAARFTSYFNFGSNYQYQQPFIQHLTLYPGLERSRHIQSLRTRIIVSLMQNFPTTEQNAIAQFAKHTLEYSTQIENTRVL